MSKQLILAARPRSLDTLVGQTRVVQAIRKHMGSGRIIKNWLFFGPKGTGKTSISRVLALCYQCIHQETFGVPCLKCRKRKASFPIYDINASDITGIDPLRSALNGAFLGVLGDGRYRVYILDEVHRLSGNAQDLLLKYLEDTPETTIFILCSTAPHKISATLRSRCVAYEMQELDSDGVEKLVTRLLKFTKSDLAADRLTDALIQKQVYSPRNVTQAVEKYLAGGTPEESAQVEGTTSIDVHALTRNLVKGDWVGVSGFIKESKEVNPRAIRAAVIGYLRTILLDATDFDDRSSTIAEALQTMCGLENAEDQVISASLVAVLYKLTSMFGAYK